MSGAPTGPPGEPCTGRFVAHAAIDHGSCRSYHSAWPSGAHAGWPTGWKLAVTGRQGPSAGPRLSSRVNRASHTFATPLVSDTNASQRPSGENAGSLARDGPAVRRTGAPPARAIHHSAPSFA